MCVAPVANLIRLCFGVVFLLLLTACDGEGAGSNETDPSGLKVGTPAEAAPQDSKGGGLTLSAAEGYLHAGSGVGFVYPGDPWRHGDPTTTPILSGVRVTPKNDRFGDELSANARWTREGSAQAGTDSDAVAKSMMQTLAGLGDRVEDMGTHEAAGVTWRVLNIESGDGTAWKERRYIHATENNGVVYTIELRIETTDLSRVGEAVPLLEQFRFPE